MHSFIYHYLLRSLSLVLLVAACVVYTACNPVKPLLTRSEVKEQRAEKTRNLQAYRDTLAQRMKQGKLSANSAATLWADSLRRYEEQLGRISMLRQPPNSLLYTSNIVFDPFGAGISSPRRVRYNRQLWVEAVNINPFKYDVELGTKAFSYTYESPAAPTAVNGAVPKSDTDSTSKAKPPLVLHAPITLKEFLAGIQEKLNTYEEVSQKLETLYRLDTRPIADTVLLRKAKNLLTHTTLTPTNFARFPVRLDSTISEVIRLYERPVAPARKTVKTLLSKTSLTAVEKRQLETAQATIQRNAEELRPARNLQDIIRGITGGVDATKQMAAIKKAETLGQLLISLRDEPNPRFRMQLLAKGDEMDTKLKLTVRPDYLVPPGRAAGKLLEWETTTQVTHRFRVSASAGAYLTGLQDYTYGLFTDSVQVRRRVDATSTTDTTTQLGFKGARRIGRVNTQESINIGFTGLTHFHYRLLPAFDVAASVGLGAQTAGIQLLAGLTVLTGGEKQRLCLTGGLIGGRVTRLSGGYHEGEKVPLTGIDTVPTQSVNKTSWFFAITYNLTGSRQE